jgi:hypothetical protein
VRDELYVGIRCAEVGTEASSEDDLVLMARNTKFVPSPRVCGMVGCVGDGRCSIFGWSLGPSRGRVSIMGFVVGAMPCADGGREVNRALS